MFQKFSFNVPGPQELLSIPESVSLFQYGILCMRNFWWCQNNENKMLYFLQRNLTEYYNAVDSNNMMLIFAR